MPHDLSKFFTPSSIAVIGASDRTDSVGMRVFKNLLQGKFLGNVYAINPKHDRIQGQRCYASIDAITDSVDLAIIATPANTIPTIIAELGKKGVQAAIVLSSGFSEIGKDGKDLEDILLTAAKNNHVRIIGPNCLGVMNPHINMNATFDNNFALPGKLALVSQSGAISAGILDWAMNKKMGFSAIASIGNNADIDFGDILNYLAHDDHTESILVYIEGIKNPRHFMSALRTAARLKPVIILKAGRNSQGSRAALSHTGALIGSDDVFDIAIRRAGAVRIFKMEDIFSIAEILTGTKKIEGNSLTIITNGGGAGVIAADRAAELRINLPELNEDITTRLNTILPKQWSHRNPIDIIGDATPERYHATLEACQNNSEVNGVLTILTPVAMSQPLKVAEQIVEDAMKSEKLILTCWMGEKRVKSARKLFATHKIPCFDTPEKAVEAFSYLVDYYHNQQLLKQLTNPIQLKITPNISDAVTMIESVLINQRTVLTTPETKKILKIFDIPVTETQEVTTLEEAVQASKICGFPIVMKVNSPDITHKLSAGGVCLNIRTEADVKDSYNKIMTQVKKAFPLAKIWGVTIEPQYDHALNREVMIGVMNDIVFGPVISFGAGGTLVELIQDRALALPPLNHFIAERLMEQTRIIKLGRKLQQISADQITQLVNILLRVSEMVCELPQIQEMDINPLVINGNGIIAVDARMIVAQKSAEFTPYSHLAIHP